MTQRYYSSTAQEMALTSAITTSTLVLTVNAVAGLPTQVPFTLVLDPGTASEEVVTVTNVAGLSLTVTRAQDGSAAQAHATASVVRHMMTARDLREPQVHIESNVGVHGLGSAAIVGTTTPQTLTGKSMSGITNTFTGIGQSAIIGLDADQAAESIARIAVSVALAAETAARIAADVKLEADLQITAGGSGPAHFPGRIWVNSFTGVIQMSVTNTADPPVASWRYIAGPITRSWISPVRTGAGDNFFGDNEYTPFGTITIPDARAGKYLLVYHAEISSTTGQVAYAMLYAGATQLLALRTDLTANIRETTSFTVDHTHDGGTVVFGYGFQGTAGVVTVQNPMTRFRVYYLGE